MSLNVPSHITDPANWKGAELADPARYAIALDAKQLADLERVCLRQEQAGQSYNDTSREDFDFREMGDLLLEVERELREGRGFVMLQGLPLGEWPLERSRLAAWGIGTWIGQHVIQTVEGQRLIDVTDMSAVDQSPRQFKTPQELRLHTDPASDLVGLACIRPARHGGDSVITSAVAVHNAMLEQRPDLLACLYEGYRWHRYGEGRPGDAPITEDPVPVFAVRHGQLSCRYVRAPMAAGHRDSGQPMTPAQIEALDLFDQLASSPSLRLSLRMAPGDMMLVNNLTVLHARTQFEDHPEADRRRHILRLWLEGNPGFRAVPPQLNFFNGGACGILPQANKHAEYANLDALYQDRASGGIANLGVTS